MANYLDIPALCPIKFIDKNATFNAQYNFKHFDDALFVNQIGSFQEKKKFNNPWQSNDAITIQVMSTLAPVVVDVIDQYDNYVLQVTATAITTTYVGQDYNVYEANIPLTGLQGKYQLQITAGSSSPVVAISEPICVQDLHPNTMLIEYSNSINKDGIYFANGLQMAFRVESRIMEMIPGSKDTLFEDQFLKEVMIRSYPFRVFKFIVSFAAGVPDYVIDRLNRIFGCDSIQIDGKLFVKNEGAKWERQGSGNLYPMAGWSIELREGGNATGTKRITGGANPDEALAVVYNIETDGFGPIENTGTNTLIQLTEIN